MNAPPALGYPPGVSLATGNQNSPTAASFGSNNPFRNRALSPATTASGASARPERPRSTNPFLDDTDALSPQSAPGMSTGGTMFSPTERSDATSHTRDLFENLSIKPTATVAAVPAPAPGSQSNGRAPFPDARNQATRSRPQDRSSGRRESKPKDPLNIFADPPSLSKASTMGPSGKSSSRRPRRNSESSVMDRASKLFDDEDEKRRRERRRERERRGDKPRSSRKDRRLDIIDKLDVTSIYGTGMFHHDGPFDACNPHRNRKGVRTAPMQAFPKNSTNMALGGSGPNNSNIDLNQFHGRSAEGYNDFNTGLSRNQETVSFDAKANLDPVHGSESMGLGTSTFLDGAPASRSAIARHEVEAENQLNANGGLQRKKSLAQRLRGRSGTGRVAPGRVGSPLEPTLSPPQQGSSHSATSRGTERNPFFQDYDEEWDKKGSRIAEARLESGGRYRSSSSPKQPTGLERKSTNERAYEDQQKLNAGGGGFLNRMKSLRKPRPERRTSD